jgi:transcriptional regulator with XRE-family HTH domain
VKATANTISRWETATYKPSISDLERLAPFFGVPIAILFPKPNQSHARMFSAPRQTGMKTISKK